MAVFHRILAFIVATTFAAGARAQVAEPETGSDSESESGSESESESESPIPSPSSESESPSPSSESESEPASESEPEPASESEPDPKLTRAKDLHRQGLALLNAGDVERALDYFQRSRDVYPSAPNVTNVAICLERLGRHDEALEAYELLLTEFADGLDAEDRASIAPAMERLRGKVASLWISANETGTVIVDGRERGKLPLRVPIRLSAGEHVVRIQKPGFQPWEKKVTVTVRQTLNLDARLAPLANVGMLRVESDVPGSVVVDGAEVGKTPWEGPLSPGEHRIWLRAGERGSAPQKLVILEGQIVLTRPKLALLGPEVSVTVTPPTATVIIDGLEMGTGGWTGRLTAGEHEVVVRERGYVEQRVPLRSMPGAPAQSLPIQLTVDRDHPRWPKPPPPPPPPGKLFVDAYLGYAGGPTMGSGAEASCPELCAEEPMTHGGIGALRFGYRFSMHLSLEVGLGYALFGTAVRRVYYEDFAGGEDLAYQLDDRPLVRGPFLAPGLGYRYPVLDWLSIGGRAALGIMFAAATNDVSGIAGYEGNTVDIRVANRDVQRTVTLFVMPSVGADFTFGDVEIGAGLGVAIFPLEGPALDNGPIRANAAPDPTMANAPGNAPASDAIMGERAWGPMALVVPHLRAGYSF